MIELGVDEMGGPGAHVLKTRAWMIRTRNPFAAHSKAAASPPHSKATALLSLFAVS
jgi:hypothetical protein